MKNRLIYLLALPLVAIACGGQEEDAVASKKKELEELKSQSIALNQKITALEREIVALDPSFGDQGSRSILISTFTVSKRPFEHKIEVRGTVESRKNVMLSAEVAGKTLAIRVKEGQMVRRGQVLIELDADIIRNNIAELKTSLELADAVYERQAALWEKNIGTEIQYLETKNNKESLERRLATAYSQLDQAIIKAPFHGQVDEIPVKVGELVMPGMELVRVVNPKELYLEADVSERFVGRFKVGDEVKVYFPAQDQSVASKITSVSNVINKDNRTFTVEVALPNLDYPVKPNQVAVLGLRDYHNPSALVVPTKLIQRDGIGNYLYQVKDDTGQKLAKKVHITPGVSYNFETEILEGLAGNEILVNEGFREVTDGTAVRFNAESQKMASK